jgi:hypothetical protein
MVKLKITVVILQPQHKIILFLINIIIQFIVIVLDLIVVISRFANIIMMVSVLMVGHHVRVKEPPVLHRALVLMVGVSRGAMLIILVVHLVILLVVLQGFV